MRGVKLGQALKPSNSSHMHSWLRVEGLGRGEQWSYCSRWSPQSSVMEAGPCVVSIILPCQLWDHTLAMLATSPAAAWSVIGIRQWAVLQMIVLYQHFDCLLVLAWPGIPETKKLEKLSLTGFFPCPEFILQMKSGQVWSPCLKLKLWLKVFLH